MRCNAGKYLLLLTLYFSISVQINSQSAIDKNITDISKINIELDIRQYIEMAYERKAVTAGQLQQMNFHSGLIDKSVIPAEKVPQKILLRFRLTNSSVSTKSVYFFPGRYFPFVRLFIGKNAAIQTIPDERPVHPNNKSYRKLTVNSGDTVTVYAELTMAKTYTNRVRPRLINEIYIGSFISDEQNTFSQGRNFTFVLCGLLLMMIFFSLTNYYQGANKEFYHYAGYAFLLGAMLFTKALTGFHSSEFNFLMESYLDFILMCTGHLFYMNFIRLFLDAQHKHPFISRLCKTGNAGLLFTIAAYSLLYFFSPGYTAEFYLENITKLFLLVIAGVFVWYARRHWHEKIFRFMAWGNGAMLLFSVISYLFTFLNPTISFLPRIFTNSLFYYQLGILVELIFFLAGLTYKNKQLIIEQTRERERLKAENQMKEIEKELAILKTQKDERNRISADMHDELGSGMTKIRLLSEMAKAKMKENIPQEMNNISESANDVLNKMNAIIWSMNSGNDTLGSLVSYIRAYAMDYFENTPVQCRVFIPEKIDERDLPGDKRRNIFLCVKETLNNALKHSGATEITITIEINSRLLIRIHDNGRGIDKDKLREFGNGLKNINKRMESIGGIFSIENKNGTVSEFTLPL